MVRKCLACFLIIGLLNLQLFAQTSAEKKAAQEAARIAQLKATITSIGLGDTAPTELKLTSGGKLIGYVSEMKDGSILFAETARATTREISYAEINSAKAYTPPSGHKPTSNKKTILWVTVFAVGMTVLAILAYKHCKKLEREGKVCSSDENTN